MQEKVGLLIKKVDPLAVPRQKTQSKFGKTTTYKTTSMSSKLQNTLPNNTDIYSNPNISVSLPPLDYNIVEDMKETWVNISFFKLTKVQSQRDILLRAMGQTIVDGAASTSKGESTPPGSLSTVFRTLQMEEANLGFPPFLLSFEVSNYNVHDFLVDSGVEANVMSLSLAKKINAQWSKTSARII